MLKFIADTDGLLAYGEEGKPIHVIEERDNEYHVYVLNPDGSEMVQHGFDNPSDALIEFAQRIRIQL